MDQSCTYLATTCLTCLGPGQSCLHVRPRLFLQKLNTMNNYIAYALPWCKWFLFGGLLSRPPTESQGGLYLALPLHLRDKPPRKEAQAPKTIYPIHCNLLKRNQACASAC